MASAPTHAAPATAQAVRVEPFKPGDRVEVRFPTGWEPGVFDGYLAGSEREGFRRLDVRLDEPGRRARGAHPDCVRPLGATA